MQSVKNMPVPGTLAELCLGVSVEYKDKLAFSIINEGKIERKITYTQLKNKSCQTGTLLNKLGIEYGDKVMLYSDNCPEWPVTYFGIAFAGAVSVPLLTGFPAEQVLHIAKHSGARVICISKSMADKAKQITKTNELKDIPFLYIDTMTEDENSNLKITMSLNGSEEELITYPCGKCSGYLNQKPDDLATIIYTSGTQGSSKGVMLSGKNLLSSAISSFSFAKMSRHDSFLSVLPLAHSYECSLGFLAPLLCGASITYLDKPPSPSVLLPALKLLRPTAMISVPLLIEKVYNNALLPELNKSRLYNFSLTRPLAALIAGRKLISAMGGRIRFFGIGGAPLSPQVEKFLHSAKFPYTVGYGLTETAPLVAGNAPFRFALGSGIVPPAGVKLRIVKIAGSNEDEGEIQVQGPNVMLGYYKDTEKTDEVFTADGWFRTGDLGRFDKKGRLHIRGRIKAMILGPSGENIYPEEIEGILGTSRLVEESLVYSGNKGELVALVRLSEAAKTAAGVIENTMEELRAWVNKKLSAFSRISRIEIKHDQFEKTPTMKIKRYLYV